MNQIIEREQQVQVLSVLFNFIAIINKSPFILDLETLHSDIGTPMLIIRDGTVKRDEIGADKAIDKRLKNLEGTEVGK